LEEEDELKKKRKVKKKREIEKKSALLFKIVNSILLCVVYKNAVLNFSMFNSRE
jgi:hypothetical protein